MTTRRNFIRSAAGILIAAPMVVRAGSIMPVRVAERVFTDRSIDRATAISPVDRDWETPA